MPSRKKDLIGERFGRLEVIEYLGSGILYDGQHNTWLCKCDCGNTVKKITNHLTRASDKITCGCKSDHNLRRSPFYRKWRLICNRVKNNDKLSIDEDWKKWFIVFKEDMYESYLEYKNKNSEQPYLLINRQETHYCKENVEWVSQQETYKDIYNEKNRIIEYNGEKRSLTRWSKKLDINRNTLLGRIHRGWDIKRILEKDADDIERTNVTKRKFELNGKHYTIDELSNNFDISKSKVYSRMNTGWSTEEIVELTERDSNHCIEIDGKKHPIKEVAKFFDCDKDDIQYWLNRGYKFDQVLVLIDKEFNKQSRIFEIDGKLYDFDLIEEEFGIKEHTLLDRLRSPSFGSVESAVKEPVKN